MRLKWDSSAARDIVAELERLEQETEDCVAEIERATGILWQMQGGDMSRVIEKYISAADTLGRKLRTIAEAFGGTGRAITRADELFDDLEARLRGHAWNMGDDAPTQWHGDAGGTAPIFYNIPQGPAAHNAPWPTLSWVRQTVVVDRVSLNAGMVTPQWLEGIIDSEQQLT